MSSARGKSRLPADTRSSSVDGRRTEQVKSLLRALGLLETIAGAADGMTLTDLAEVVGLPTSTTHRLLTTMQQKRFVRFEPTTSAWQIGVQCFITGTAFTRTRQVIELARPHMRGLMEEAGETVNLALEDDGEAVYMAQVECRQLVRAIARTGDRVMMHASGTGKAMLAWLPEEKVTTIVRRHGLRRVTERTIDTPQRLWAELERIRRLGYALDDEEYAVGVRCLAAAIFDEEGAPRASLSLSGPIARLPEDRLSALGAVIARVAATITAEFGGRPPRG